MRVHCRVPGLIVLCLAWSAPGVQAQVVRYQGELRGDLTMTGNSLGLSKQSQANGPGQLGSIGTFITTDPSSMDDVPANVANPWPGGTTPIWQLDGSSGVLSLPPAAFVVHAELLWGGSYSYVEDVSAFLDVPVTLRGALGGSLAVVPDPIASVTLSGFSTSGLYPVNYYLRSADVTAFVRAQGPGTYATLGVPGTQHESVDSLNAAGWSLLVAYGDPGEPYRTLAIVTDGRFVEEGSDADVTFRGLSTPVSGPGSGRLWVVAMEGDAQSTGDQVRIRPDAAPFVTLSGPNNPSANFFASQVNDSSGLIDPLGSFGTSNHDAFLGTNSTGARQGWDMTAVALDAASGHLVGGQTSATIRSTTTGDATILMAVALAVRHERRPVRRLRPASEPDLHGAVVRDVVLPVVDDRSVPIEVERHLLARRGRLERAGSHLVRLEVH